jgi:hypothetical protein
MTRFDEEAFLAVEKDFERIVEILWAITANPIHGGFPGLTAR